MMKIAKCPVPPEHLAALKSASPQMYEIDQKTESWAIGILMISMANLCSDQLLYNWRTLDIDKRSLNDLLRGVYSRYSQLFGDMVKRCLSDNPHERPLFNDIKEYIWRRNKSN